jgi:hypothetical protein
MGRFGKNRVPNFMKGKEDAIGANPRVADENLDEMHPVEIVSLGDHGDDHAMIVIRSKSGEELELRFDYDGNGMLTAMHGDHEYSIPVELEVVSDEIDEKLKGKQKNLDKNRNGKIDSGDFKLLNKSKEDTEGKASNTFENFVNECWSPMTEGYSPAMSEEAQNAVKSVCEEILIKEAQMCDEDADPNHTYENYLNEVGSYMSKCMMEAAAEVDVEEPINERAIQYPKAGGKWVTPDASKYVVYVGKTPYKVTVKSPIYSGPIIIQHIDGPKEGWMGNYYTVTDSKGQTKDFDESEIAALVKKEGSNVIELGGALGKAIFTKA